MANNYITIFEGTDLNVGAREVTEPDGITKRHQTAVVASGVLELPNTPQIENVNTSGDYPANPIDIRGYGNVIVKSVFTQSGQNCEIRFVLYLSDGTTVIGESESLTISTTDRTEGTSYIGEMIVFDNSKVGASYLKINLVTPPSTGSVSFYIGGV